MTSTRTVIEICAGAGGQSLGLELAGFSHKLAIELDPTAAATLHRNRPHWDVRIGDVADSDVWVPAHFAPKTTESLGPIDLFAGGVPCPPFSIAGKQLGTGDERDLFAWAIEQVGVLRPNAVMLENVKGLSQARFAGYRQHVLDRLSEFGYEAEWRLLQASDFGVPQLRPRFVLIAMLPEYFKHFHWPTPAPERSTVGQVLLPLMSEHGWESAGAWAKGASTIAPTIVGGSKKHGGADLGPTRAKAAWKQLGVDGRGIADNAPMPGDTFDVGPRLTLEMVKRIQGWNGEDYAWDFEGRKTSVYRQIGNAFPPPVARALGASVLGALEKSAPVRLDRPTKAEADSIIVILRQQDNYVESKRLMREAGLALNDTEFDKRMASIGRDFTVHFKNQGGKQYYKLGEFLGFVGQEEHGRHEYLRTQRTRVS